NGSTGSSPTGSSTGRETTGSGETGASTTPATSSRNACSVSDSPFTLPIPGGTSVFVAQGNSGQFSHNTQFSLHAFDLPLKRGAPLVAIAAGTVEKVSDATKPGTSCFEGGGIECIDKANYVVVRHADGHDSLYLHLESVQVKVGETVKRGDVVG